MKLEFDEIKDWQEFEDMIAEYFRQIKSDDNNVIDVAVEPTGNGSDGGRDILVTFKVNDSINSFKRKWVIQCKFHTGILKEKEMATINIPGKIHEYGADGFLLVVKDRVHANISKMFENFKKNCKFYYNYDIWTGNNLKTRIQEKDKLMKQYFPNYYSFTKEQEKKLEGIL